MFKRYTNYIKSSVKITFVGAAIASSVVSAHGQVNAGGGVVLYPPNIDFAAVCKTSEVVRAPLTQDWTTWNGENLDLDYRAASALISEYTFGSERVEASPLTAFKILNAAEAAFPTRMNDLSISLSILIRRSVEVAELVPDIVDRLIDANEAGRSRAGLELAFLKGLEGPTTFRDLETSRRYLQKAAAAGELRGLYEYIKVISNDTNIPQTRKNLIVLDSASKINLAISQGNCSGLRTMATLYSTGIGVEKNIAVALKWLEADAANGGERSAYSLSKLYKSARLEEIDVNKSVRYLKQAADAGITSASLQYGKLLVTGEGVDRDFEQAIKYLNVASEAGFSSADSWLADVYAGKYGGEVQKELATQYYERVLQSLDNKSTRLDYADFLLKYGTSDQELIKTIKLLEISSEDGSSKATEQLGGMYLDLARLDKSRYFDAVRYLNRAMELGSSDGAYKLSNMYSCGFGVPQSFQKSNDLLRQAAVLGSDSSLYLTALNFMESEDSVLRSKGRTYLRQAAYKGNDRAIGYAMPRWELGVDGFKKRLDLVEKLNLFIDRSEDVEYQNNVRLRVILNRFELARTPEEVAKQFDAIDAYIEAGVLEAYRYKASMLKSAGNYSNEQLLDLYKYLAENDDPIGMREYGRLLLADLTNDVAIGQSWLQKSADAGDTKAQLFLIDPADEQALSQLEQIVTSYNKCSVDVLVNISKTFASLPDQEAKQYAFYWLDYASQLAARDADDLFNIGTAYRDGIAGIENRPLAENWFKKSASLGRKSVLRELAEGHLQGWWENSDVLEAKALLLEQLKLGDLDAGNKLIQEISDKVIPATVSEVQSVLDNVGDRIQSPAKNYLSLTRMNLDGQLGEPDETVVLDWLTNSASAGNENSMYRLYRAYFFGTYGDIDLGQAFSWLENAAELGNEKSIKELAIAYEVGVDGLAKDPEKAAMWKDRADQL